MTFPVLPDPEAALVTFLAAHASLAPLHDWVGTQVQATAPGIQVTSLGGPQPWPWEATAEFALSSWGGTKAQASALDRTLRSVVYELAGAPVTGGHTVGVGVPLAGLWAPDENTDRPRYRTDLALTIYP